jgi:beta-galactosidase
VSTRIVVFFEERSDMKPGIQFDRIWHGGDYNPDQWDERIWDEDVQLMQKAGWSIATLPVFSWVKIQPDEQTWNFDWLDRVLDKLHAGGIGVCMATSTASVPKWATGKYPDILVTDQNGKKLKAGGRHVFCPHSPNYRRLSVELARRIATRYANHPALKIWHIGNEYGGSNTGGRCYCELCENAFREWLHLRYGSLENLNHRWNTAFWSHTYTSWDEVEAPFAHGERSIESLQIDYDRFQSESLLDCYRAEAKILREITPKIAITTNLMGAYKPLDYHAWARDMDIVSWDSYPPKGAPPEEMAFSHSLMRGLKEGQPWLLMEQTPSQQNWQSHNALKRPGVMRLWSYQAVAHGADSVMYFQWRRSRCGPEKFHGAVVEHVGTSEPRVFREVAALGKELRELGTQTLGGRVKADAALLFDWENWWALEYSKGPSVDVKYVPVCRAFFDALHRQGVTCDVVSPHADLSKYKVVVAPLLYMVKNGVAENLTQFVESGATLVTSFFSGLVDDCDSVHLGGYPGPLRKLLGVWVEETDVMFPGESNRMIFEDGARSEYSCGLLCDRVHPESAQTLAIYGDDFYAGEAALTMNKVGQGRAYYLASLLDSEGLQKFLGDVCSAQNVSPVLPQVQSGVEAMRRVSPDGTELLYVLNHNAMDVEVALPDGEYSDLLSNQEVTGRMILPRYGAAILKAM